MPTTGIITAGGTAGLKLYKDVSSTMTPIACLTDFSFNVDKEEIDVTCHDTSGDWGAFLAGRNSGNVSFSGFYDQSSSNVTADDIYDDLVAGTTVSLMISTGTTGDRTYTMNVKLLSWEASAANKGEAVTFSSSGRITGAVTTGTVA